MSVLGSAIRRVRGQNPFVYVLIPIVLEVQPMAVVVDVESVHCKVFAECSFDLQRTRSSGETFLLSLVVAKSCRNKNLGNAFSNDRYHAGGIPKVAQTSTCSSHACDDLNRKQVMRLISLFFDQPICA